FRSYPVVEVAMAHLKADEANADRNRSAAQSADLNRFTGLGNQVVRGPSVERIEMNTAQNKEFTDPNSVNPVLGDIEMRRALLYATPKQQIIDKLFFGKAQVGSSPVSQGWAASKGPQEGTDPKKANDTLDKAGWVKGAGGIRVKNGARATLGYTTPTDDATRATLT